MSSMPVAFSEEEWREWRQNHPLDYIIFWHDGRYLAVAYDASKLGRMLNLPVTEESLWGKKMVVLSIPEAGSSRTFFQIVTLGHRAIVIDKERNPLHYKTGASRKLKEGAPPDYVQTSFIL